MSEFWPETVAVEPPDENDGLSSMMQVASVSGDFRFANQAFPVVGQPFVDPLRWCAAQVVADRVDPPRSGRRGSDVVEDEVEGWVAEVHEEPLEEHPVDAILFHPAEVAIDRQWVGRTEEIGRLAVGESKAGGWVKFVRGQLGQVGPHVKGESFRGDSS